MSDRHVVIIGGGITGLSAAFFLKRFAQRAGADIRVSLIEADDHVGGKIKTYRDHGLVVEAGPDSILARKQAGVRLIRELGIAAEMVGMPSDAGGVYVLHEGRLVPFPTPTMLGIPADWRALATPLLSVGGKLRALTDLVLPRQFTGEDESLGHFLRRRLGNELVDRLAEPMMAGIYAGKADDLSLLATFPQLAELEKKHRSLILGAMRQRRSAPPAHRETEVSLFVTLRAGLQTLIERLYDTLQPTTAIHTRTRAVELAQTAGSKYRVIVTSSGQRNTLVADAVILTVPTFEAAALLKKLTPAASRLETIGYVSTATVVLAYPSHAAPDFDGSGFLVPRSEGGLITACTVLSRKWPHTAPGDMWLIRCFVGRAGQQDALRLPDPDLVYGVQRQLEHLFGVREQPLFARVTRWPRAMPQYGVGHLDTVAQLERTLVDAAPGVALAGAGYRGLGLPDCIEQARRAVKQVWTHLNLPEVVTDGAS
jgi:oxygen-dependent protoporphyrinogen oxidase